MTLFGAPSGLLTPLDTRSRKRLVVPHPRGELVVDLHPLTGPEMVAIVTKAHAFADAQGLDQFDPTGGLRALCVSREVRTAIVALSCLDPGSPANNPSPFFSSVADVRALGAATLDAIYEAHDEWQQQCIADCLQVHPSVSAGAPS